MTVKRGKGKNTNVSDEPPTPTERCAHDLGTAPEARIQYRYRDLPGVQWPSQDYCLYRRPSGDPEDTRAPEGKGRMPGRDSVTREPRLATNDAIRLRKLCL